MNRIGEFVDLAEIDGGKALVNHYTSASGNEGVVLICDMSFCATYNTYTKEWGEASPLSASSAVGDTIQAIKAGLEALEYGARRAEYLTESGQVTIYRIGDSIRIDIKGDKS